ncbi:MAG: response regulator [Planctomycetota bacterium]|nr:MAG: response regulator [Planctomycetota bacterium]
MAKILVAEDDRHICRVITMWLTRNGHEVIAAENGKEALQLIREHRPDLLLTDINMPGIDGLNLLKTVKEESLISHRSIVLTSRCDQVEIKTRVKELNAEVYPKPFSPLHLTEAIESSLAAADEKRDRKSATIAAGRSSEND